MNECTDLLGECYTDLEVEETKESQKFLMQRIFQGKSELARGSTGYYGSEHGISSMRITDCRMYGGHIGNAAVAVNSVASPTVVWFAVVISVFSWKQAGLN